MTGTRFVTGTAKCRPRVYVTGPISVNYDCEISEIAAIFLRLGLPSALIRHENGAFRKRYSSSRRNLKTPLGLAF